MKRATLLLSLFLHTACGEDPATIDLRVPAGAVELAGTLYLPSAPGPHPAVVVVHGSGPQTRDAYVPLARTFARHGVAALVYDKRGTGASTGDWRRSPFGALADDAQAAIEFVAGRAEVDSNRVGVWGGSEGGWIAPWVASRSPRVAFVIVQSAPVVDAGRQHLFQVEQLVLESGGSPEQVQEALDYVRMQHRYSTSGEGWDEYARRREINRSGFLSMLGGPPAPDDTWWAWWKTKRAFDPLAAWAGVSVPVLAIWGDRDRNVPVEESRVLLDSALRRSGNDSATLVVVKNADHDLMPGGLGRARMVVTRLVRQSPGMTPSMERMAEWASETTAGRLRVRGASP